MRSRRLCRNLRMLPVLREIEAGIKLKINFSKTNTQFL